MNDRARRIAAAMRTPQAAAAVSGAVWLAVSWGFAAQQEIWVDESSQLAGLTLNPVEALRWLLGQDRERFGLQGGSAPPLSFWGGWLWSQAFGLSEASLRAFGMALGTGATVVVALAAGRAWGAAAAWVAGLAFALSPNVIEIGVEIRPYPLLLLCSALAFSVPADPHGSSPAMGRSRWIALMAACLAGFATHFFGVVMAGGAFLAALWLAWRGKTGLRPGLICGVVLLLALPAVVPFVRATVDQNVNREKGEMLFTAAETSRTRPLARYAYRMLGGHPSHQVFLPLLVSTLVGTAALLALALRRKDRSPAGARAILLGVAAGAAATLGLHLLKPELEVLSPRYSTWMLPALAIAAGSAVAAGEKRPRIAAWGAAALLLVGNAGATAILLRHGSAFAHTPAERIIREIRSRGAAAMVVVHDHPEYWGSAYYPLRYEFGLDLRQYRAVWSPDGVLTLPRLPNGPATGPAFAGDTDQLLLASSRSVSSSEIAAFLKTGRAPDLNDGRLDAAMERMGWEKTVQETHVAQLSVELRWYRKRR